MKTPWANAKNPDRELTDVDPRNVRSFGHLERQSRRCYRRGLGQRNWWARKEGKPETKSTRRRWLTCVTTTAIEIPEWARKLAHPAMSQSAHYVWLRCRPRKDAKRLAAEDQEQGGSPEMVAVEYRSCRKCGRILLALEAEARRRLDESCWRGRELPCGAECG